MTPLQPIVNQIICLSTTLSLENVQNERRITTESIFASIHSLLLIDAVGMSYSLFRIEFYFLIEESLKSPLFCFAHCVGVLILKTLSFVRCQKKQSCAQRLGINYFQRGRVPAAIIHKFSKKCLCSIYFYNKLLNMLFLKLWQVVHIQWYCKSFVTHKKSFKNKRVANVSEKYIYRAVS